MKRRICGTRIRVLENLKLILPSPEIHAMIPGVQREEPPGVRGHGEGSKGRKSRVHADRAVGRDRDHRGLGRPPAAGGAGGAVGGASRSVREQLEADGARAWRTTSRPSVVIPRPMWGTRSSRARSTGVSYPDGNLEHASGVCLGDVDPALPGANADLLGLQFRPPVLGARQRDRRIDQGLGVPLPVGHRRQRRVRAAPLLATATTPPRTTPGSSRPESSSGTATTSPTPGSTSRGAVARRHLVELRRG